MNPRLSSASRVFLCRCLCAAAIFLGVPTLGRGQEGEEPRPPVPEREQPYDPAHPPKPNRPAPNLDPNAPPPDEWERAARGKKIPVRPGSVRPANDPNYWTGGKLPVPPGIPADWNQELPPAADGNDYGFLGEGGAGQNELPPAPGGNYDIPELMPKPPAPGGIYDNPELAPPPLPPPPKFDPDEHRPPPKLPDIPPEPPQPKNDPDSNRKVPKLPKDSGRSN